MSLKNKRQICVIDSETDPFKHGRIPKPFIWGFYNTDTEEYQEFTETEDLIEFLAPQDIIVYAHNGGKFDYHFITEFIEAWEPITIINGRLAKFNIGMCEFRDSYNLIPAPLSAYKKDEIDYGIFEADKRNKADNMAKIREYMKHDCIYLGEMVKEFIKEYGLNLTQASTAMKVWSKMSGISKPNSGAYYYENMSQYYYGGRVECFKQGLIDFPFYVIDIISAYPYAMMHEHPWGMNYSTLDTIKGLSDEQIQRSFISLRARSNGAFPYRTKKGLRFPNDNIEREFHISGWEYLAARDTQTLSVTEIIEVRTYHETINFREYVDHFFDMKDRAKQAGDNAGYLFAKIFLNSLYGKFASNPENYQEFMTVPLSTLKHLHEEEGWMLCKELNADTCIVNRPLQEEKHRFYDVAVAASITGFVRAYLWRNICSCENVLYCDTDSIAATGIDAVKISKNLGDWEVEAICTEGAIAGKKLYAFKKKDGSYKIASKGVRLEAKQIYKIAKGETVIDLPEVPTFSPKKKTPIFTPRSVKMLENDEIPF